MSIEVVHEADLQALKDGIANRDLTIKRLEKDVDVLKYWLGQAHDRVQSLESALESALASSLPR